jgi:hypothetical protein
MKKRIFYKLKRCLRDFKTKDHLCLYPDLFCSYISGPWNWFVKLSTVPPNVGLRLFLFVFFIWSWASSHWLFFFFYAQNFGSFGFFFMPPSFVWAPSMIENFLLCPPVLFGHFHRWRLFMPPSTVWALSIIKDFLALAPSVGCDPSQGYFQKTLPGSKGDCKGYILALWKDYQRWPFFISNACT